MPVLMRLEPLPRGIGPAPGSGIQQLPPQTKELFPRPQTVVLLLDLGEPRLQIRDLVLERPAVMLLFLFKGSEALFLFITPSLS